MVSTQFGWGRNELLRPEPGAGVSGWTERWFVLEGKRVMYYNNKGDRHPRGTLELNAGSRLKKIPTKEHAFHVVSDKQVTSNERDEKFHA